MEVRRSRGGKAALVIGGNNYIKFITIGGSCPVFVTMELRDFHKEFNKVLPMTEYEAALSFLKVAKNCLKHNPEVINFLLGEIIMRNVSEMTLAEVTSRYNSLCIAAGKKPRKSFDSKRVALEALEKLDSETKVASVAQEQSASESTRYRSTKMNEQVEGAEVKEVKVRGKGIGARAMELLIAGKSTQEVIDTVKAEIPDANPTGATVAWYKNKLRKEGKIAMPVKKEKVVKAAKTKAAPVETEEVEEVEGE